MGEKVLTESTQEEGAEKIAEEAAAEETLEEGEVVETGTEAVEVSIADIVSGKPAEDKTPAWAKERFDELTREKYTLKAEIEKKDRIIREIESKSASLTERPVPPDRYEYDEDASYRKAMVEWKDKDDLWKEQIKQREQAVDSYHLYEKDMFDNFEKRAGTMRKKYPDFDTSVADFIPPMSDGKHMYLRDELLESELGPEIGYYLAKNPKETQRIVNLSQRQITREIAVLEQRFQTANKTKSGAPEVIVPIEGSEVFQKDTSKMSDAEWYAWEKKRNRERLEAKFKGGQ